MAKQPEWTITGEALQKFLLCLDPDVQRAGEIYETIRVTLIKFFDWRGAHFPEECADETFNRVMRKLDEGDVIADVKTYCQGVARFVLMEARKAPDAKRSDFETLPPLVAPATTIDETNPHLDCFTNCLRALPDDGRQLILQYYQDEKRSKINNRIALAHQLGIPLNAVRSRAQRLRNKLEECVHSCVKKNADT